MRQFGYPASKRLRQPEEFERVYNAQQKRGDRYLLVFAATNDLQESRCGISVSKRHGNAVKRARIKRLLREAFRLSQHDLPKGLDFVLIPRQDSGAGLAEFRESLKQLAWKLARSIHSKRSQEAGRDA